MLLGHRGGSGRPALLLHGGAAVPDYLGGCAEALDGLFESFRYTQRGTPPSGGDPPYTVETHVADAVAVLDHVGSTAPGRSATPGRASRPAPGPAAPSGSPDCLLIDPLGADPGMFPEVDANLRRGLSDAAARAARRHRAPAP